MDTDEQKFRIGKMQNPSQRRERKRKTPLADSCESVPGSSDDRVICGLYSADTDFEMLVALVREAEAGSGMLRGPPHFCLLRPACSVIARPANVATSRLR